MKVGGPRCHNTHDLESDAVSKIAGALGGKCPPATGAVLVGAANQLDRGSELSTAQVLKDKNFIGVEAGKIHLNGNLRARRRPDRNRGARLGAGQPVALEHRDVHFQLWADNDFRFGKILRRQSPVQLLGNERGPGVMKPFPAARPVQRRAKMIQEGHAHRPHPIGWLAWSSAL
jgi:hypothetical protein